MSTTIPAGPLGTPEEVLASDIPQPHHVQAGRNGRGHSSVVRAEGRQAAGPNRRGFRQGQAHPPQPSGTDGGVHGAGQLRGEQVSGIARVLPGSEADDAKRLITRKVPF